MDPFSDRLLAASKANESLVCVGLDPDPPLMAIPDVASFNRAIVDATKDLVCAYKPNLAFYEAQGSKGIRALEETVEHIRDTAPGVIVLGDGKRGDIGSTTVKYAQAMFETWGFDAATVNAYAGGDSIEPFLEYADRGIFVLCKTSNAGAAEFQDRVLADDDGGTRLYEEVARRANRWNAQGNVGLVVGATYPRDLVAVRAICPELPILLPGVGTQSGDLEASVVGGTDGAGRRLIVSSSRSIIYASKDPNDFADAARTAVQTLREEVNRILTKEGAGW